MPDYTPGQPLASCDLHEQSPLFLLCFSEFEEAVQNELYLNALRKTLKQLKPDTYSSITIEEYEDYKKYCAKHTHLPKIVSPFEVITDGLFQSFQNPPGGSFKTLFESLEIFMVLSFLIEKAKNPPRV